MSYVREEEERHVLCDHRFHPDFIRIFIISIVTLMLAAGSLMLTSPNISLKDNAAAASSLPVGVAPPDSTPLRSLYISKGPLLHRPAPFLKHSPEILKAIDRYSTLEIKTVAIGEIVVQSKDHDLLTTYVHNVLKADNVISDVHKEAVLAMVKLAPPEAFVNRVEIGEKGTLRNSELMAMMKHHEDHIHFMLIGVRAEPRLGWRVIRPAARNLWNDALSRLVAQKVRAEANTHLSRTPPRAIQRTEPRATAYNTGLDGTRKTWLSWTVASRELRDIGQK